MVDSSYECGLEALRAHYREKKMSETVSIKKENLQKAYDDSCEDVQEVLLRIFPDAIEKEEEEDEVDFCCSNFEKYYRGDRMHGQFIFDSEIGDYYVFPDTEGWMIVYCPTCGAKYDDKKWTPRV